LIYLFIYLFIHLFIYSFIYFGGCPDLVRIDYPYPIARWF
jgi:hypothetical protein